MPAQTYTANIAECADVYLRIGGLEAGLELTPALVAAVDAFCDQVEDAAGPLVAVVHLVAAGEAGEGRAWPGGVGIHLVTKWERALRRLERLPAATIALASGRCEGGAAEALLATDYRVATQDFRFRVTPPAGSSWPGMAVHRLAHQLGVARARHLVLFGAQICAEQARTLGLLDCIGDDSGELVLSAAKALAPLAPAEVAVRRRLLLDAATSTFENALGVHLAACDRALRRTPSTTGPVDDGLNDR